MAPAPARRLPAAVDIKAAMVTGLSNVGNAFRSEILGLAPGGTRPRGPSAALPRHPVEGDVARVVLGAGPRHDADHRHSGTVSGSGSSTSTYFCSEWISSSRDRPGTISSAISRSATTGFLSLSRSTVRAHRSRSCGRDGSPAERARSGSRPCRCSLRRSLTRAIKVFAPRGLDRRGAMAICALILPGRCTAASRR
jgi:hypothetical protein